MSEYGTKGLGVGQELGTNVLDKPAAKELRLEAGKRVIKGFEDHPVRTSPSIFHTACHRPDLELAIFSTISIGYVPGAISEGVVEHSRTGTPAPPPGRPRLHLPHGMR